MHGVSDAPALLLVVDDDEHALRAMTRILERAGHEVAVAASCAEVESRLSNGLRPDVVLTDVVLDGPSTGSRVARLVQSLSPRTRVVFVSGYAKVKIPGHVVLQKPFSARELVELVEQVRMASSSSEALARQTAFETARNRTQ